MRLLAIITTVLFVGPLYAQPSFKIVGKETVTEISDWVWDVNRRAHFKLLSDGRYLFKFANGELREYSLEELTTPGIVPYWNIQEIQFNFPVNRPICIGGS